MNKIDDSSARRVFTILEMFERERRPLSLKELAEYCRIPTSTCHSLVHSLLNGSYLYQLGSRKELYPTRRIYDMGSTIIAHDPVLQRLRPVMEMLRDQTGETVILGKRQKDVAVYLEVLEGTQTIRYSASSGDQKPLHSTSIGKAILSGLDPKEVRAWVESVELTKVTDATITTYGDLMAALEEGRNQGYFVTRGENVTDVIAMSVPIRMNNELLGLAVAGPKHRMEESTSQMADRLQSARNELIAAGIIQP